MKKLIIALTLASTAAFAQQMQMPQMPDMDALFFKQFDANQDGQVSKNEFIKPTEAQFDHMDKNGDGALDAAEVKAFNEQMTKRMQELQRQMQQQGMPQR